MIDDLESLEVGSQLVDQAEAEENEWLEKRLGKFTCSRFGDLIGAGRKKDDPFSQTALSYIKLVVAERLGSSHTVSARAMEWGKENEPFALAEYVERSGNQIDHEPYRFFEFNDHIGGTPDALVGEYGCVEVKCPWNPAEHVNTLVSREVPKQYTWQVYGHLLVTGRKWVDFVSFDPRVRDSRKLAIIRVERDEQKIEFLKNRLLECQEKAIQLMKLTE